MGKLTLKHEQLQAALDRLGESIEDLVTLEKQFKEGNLERDDRRYRRHRDSLIQRFEFCTDLFWKYLKRYLEEAVNQKIEVNAPTPVIRQACKAKLLSEEDAELAIVMIKDRNMSSHIYKEEVADQIALNTKGYYKLMRTFAEKLLPSTEISPS